MNKRWQVLLACLGIFAAGAVCGGVVALRWLAPPAGQWRPGERGRIAEQLLKRWSTELNLTVEQKEKIRPILLNGDDELWKLRSEAFRSTTAVFDRMHAEVGAVLTPDQRTKLEELRERFRRRFKNRGGRGGDTPRPETPPPPAPSKEEA